MKLPKIKIEKYKLVVIIAWTALFLVIAYEIFFLDGVKQNVGQQVPVVQPQHIMKIDQTALGIAAQRYQTDNAFNFTPTPVANPFGLNIKPAGGP